VARTLSLETPDVYLPLLKPARYKGAFGGRGSAKSHTFAEMLLERCLMHLGTRWACVREYQRTLQESVKRLLDDKIRAYNLGYAFRSLNTHIETPGGGVIIFQGMQAHNAESIKSLEGYDGAWVEEAQVLSQRSLDLLRPTIRKPGSEIWFTWNPRTTQDPVDLFLRGRKGDAFQSEVKPPTGAIVVQANWQHNPWFPEVLADEMEWDRRNDPHKYAHVWLGGYEDRTEATVFTNWRIEDFETPEDVVFYFGGDWGFAKDPTCLVRCWIDGRKLMVDREAYGVGVEIDATPALFDRIENGIARAWTITADSARPETISYLRRHGYPKIRPANKGPRSVEEGVAFLQSFEIVVHPSCRHVIDELTLYRYKTDKLTGQVLPKLEDTKNHTIDSLRYATEQARKARPHLGSGVGIGYAGKRSKHLAESLMRRESRPEKDGGESDHEGAVLDQDGSISEQSRQGRRVAPSGW